MIEMTLSSRHRTRNSSPGGLRPARYLSVTEAPHNTDFHTWMGKKHFCFFQTAETGNRTPDSGVKGSGANHYPRAPARFSWDNHRVHTGRWINVVSLLAHRLRRWPNIETPLKLHRPVLTGQQFMFSSVFMTTYYH